MTDASVFCTRLYAGVKIFRRIQVKTYTYCRNNTQADTHTHAHTLDPLPTHADRQRDRSYRRDTFLCADDMSPQSLSDLLTRGRRTGLA